MKLVCVSISCLLMIVSGFSACGAGLDNANSYHMMETAKNMRTIFGGKLIQQTQHEIDLENGCLWYYSYTLDASSGDFVAIWGQQPKEAIINLQHGEVSTNVNADRGVAFIDSKFYVVSALTGKWSESDSDSVLSAVERFDCITLLTSSNIQSFLLGDKDKKILTNSNSNLPTESLLNQINAAKGAASHLKFTHDSWLFDVDTDPEGLIKNWTVSKDGLAYRLITNKILKFEPLKLLPLSNSLQRIDIEHYSIEETYKALGDVPVLGLYITKSHENSYVAGSVIKGSASDKAGIRVGDTIEEINGKIIKDLSIDQVAGILKESDNVQLKWENPDHKKSSRELKKEVLSR